MMGGQHGTIWWHVQVMGWVARCYGLVTCVSVVGAGCHRRFCDPSAKQVATRDRLMDRAQSSSALVAQVEVMLLPGMCTFLFPVSLTFSKGGCR